MRAFVEDILFMKQHKQRAAVTKSVERGGAYMEPGKLIVVLRRLVDFLCSHNFTFFYQTARFRAFTGRFRIFLHEKYI